MDLYQGKGDVWVGQLCIWNRGRLIEIDELKINVCRVQRTD